MIICISFHSNFLFLHVQDAVKDNVPELDSPLHGEVRPVQVGGEEDEADAVLRMPVEDGATNPHEAIPALHILTGILNIIRSLKKINIDLLLVIEGIQSTLGNVGSNSRIGFIIHLSSSIMKCLPP